jgi:hypothetical protein
MLKEEKNVKNKLYKSKATKMLLRDSLREFIIIYSPLKCLPKSFKILNNLKGERSKFKVMK